MSPILRIVGVKFLSGSRTDGRRRLFLLSFLLQSVSHSARRTSLQELVNIPWSGGRNVGNNGRDTLLTQLPQEYQILI